LGEEDVGVLDQSVAAERPQLAGDMLVEGASIVLGSDRLLLGDSGVAAYLCGVGMGAADLLVDLGVEGLSDGGVGQP
jgi:hypothetical protein